MTDLMRFNASDLPALLERLNKNSIGMDEYFDRLFKVHESTQNYPPYNVIQLNNVETVLELALAGFKQDEVNVYTCLLYTSPSPRDGLLSRMPSSA